MPVYDISGNQINAVYDKSGNSLDSAYNLNGDVIFKKGYNVAQTYLGGYIEIQPDSWDGSTAVTTTIVDTTDSTAWGFPMSLSSDSKASIKADILKGDGTGIMFIRFPLGFAYRGARNIDTTTGLAKNFGERWNGQNSSLADWFSDIAQAGGGLAPEYWCIPPYWLTSGSLSGSNNQLRAGGSYSQSTTLASIRTSDPTQYATQIDAFTDAVMNDLEYLNENIAPVKMFGLSNEPQYGTQRYGACKWDAQTYNDVLEVLYPKLLSAFPNIKLHVASSDESNPFTGIASTFIANHAEWIWGYSHHLMRLASGESGNGADSFYKSSNYATIKGTKENVFLNEYEYFSVSSRTNEFRCANNMVHLIDEMVYGGAEVLHPIIHICKPTGQSASSTNTTGYCLYAVDVSDGSYTVNAWAYNSWKMFNDNLPIGSQLVTDYSIDTSDVGFMATVKNDKLNLFMANCSSASKSITVNFGTSKTFTGKLYNLTNLGIAQSSISGSSLTFTIPAYSGLVYMETTDDLLLDRLLVWNDEFNGTKIDVSKWSNVYGNYRGYNWNSPDIDRNTDVADGIMSYWTAKDYPNNVSNYSGAYIHTNNKFEFRYGRIEAKMRFPSASPHHTTFWTLGACGEVLSTGEDTLYNDTMGVKFPSCGEIDIAEYDNGSVGARMHWSTSGFDTTAYTQGGNINSLTNTPTDWHIYSCEWTENTIAFYVDGVQKVSWDTSNATVNGWNPFKIPHYLIFDCISALSGTINWDIAKTDVAWVRVYAPEGVTEYITETAISIPSTLSIAVNGRSYLTPTFTPENPSDMTIIWESDNDSVAVCYGGMVTGVSAGTAHITCTTKHGYTASCTVTVS